jgi:hypothetical protein
MNAHSARFSSTSPSRSRTADTPVVRRRDIGSLAETCDLAFCHD